MASDIGKFENHERTIVMYTRFEMCLYLYRLELI